MPREVLIGCLPLLVNHLCAKSHVVHSYAAHCLERVFTMKTISGGPAWVPHLHSQAQKVHSPNKCMSGVVRVGSMIIFRLRELWESKFFTLCDVIFMVRLQGKLKIADHSWDWKFLRTCMRTFVRSVSLPSWLTPRPTPEWAALQHCCSSRRSFVRSFCWCYCCYSVAGSAPPRWRLLFSCFSGICSTCWRYRVRRRTTTRWKVGAPSESETSRICFYHTHRILSLFFQQLWGRFLWWKKA